MAVALALAVSVWPVAVCLATVCALVVVLAWRAPPWALWLALLLFGFEGSVKLLLGLTADPLPVGNRAAGAAALDVAVFAAVVGILVADGLATPRRIWRTASRHERTTMLVLGSWLALSVLQIPQSGHLGRGLDGFRLLQSYTVIAIATAAVFAYPPLRRRGGLALLTIGLIVGGYAVFRVIVGPAAAEVRFATSVPTVTHYGGVLRAVGSFSSAVGLSSFLTPMVVFSLVIGLLMPRARSLAWLAAALGIIGLIGSYSRGSLLGVVLGLVCAVAVLLAVAEMPVRRKLGAGLIVVAVLGATYAGVRIASTASPQLRSRAHGVLHPFSDKSVKLRFKTWRRALRDVAEQPLGRGIGTVGGSTPDQNTHIVTTDNGFLQVLVEQGILGGALFLGGLLSAVVLIARRLHRLRGDPRAIGLAALAGFVAFLGICVTGDYLDQPGKVIAWGLLGVAAAQALGTDPASKLWAPRPRS